MNRIHLALVLGTLGVAACSHLREPSDAQLTTLLRSDRSGPVNAKPSLDAGALDCLKAWSGDAELLRGLSVKYAGEDGKKSCRVRIDGWVADVTRNPEHYTFAEISVPQTVRRAMKLQQAGTLASLQDPATQKIPAALTRPGAAPSPLRTPDPAVDLGVAGAKLQEAETLCTQAQQASADPGAASNLKKFSAFCSGNLRSLRATMEQAARNGQSAERLDAIANSATNVANIARNLLAAGKKQ